MIRLAKRLYNGINSALRLSLLGFLFLVKLLAVSIRKARRPRNLARVHFLQFPVRSDYAGGDAVVNGYIREAITANGIAVVMHYPPVRRAPGVGLARWLFGDLWATHCHVENAIRGDREAVLITDSQLCLGLFSLPTVVVCHFSYLGYNWLVNRNRDPQSLLDFATSSMVQAFGLLGTHSIAVSEFQKRFLNWEGVIVADVINNPMSVRVEAPVTKTGDFIFLGGHSHYGKGFDVLEALAQKGFSIDCYTTGRAEGMLHYRQAIPHREVLDTISRYRILLHPSRFESCGMTALEAMSCGVPVIMAAVGVGHSLKREIPEFVVAGYGSDAVEEYRRKATRILGDYERYSRLAREYVQRHHSLEEFKANWLRVLDANAARS